MHLGLAIDGRDETEPAARLLYGQDASIAVRAVDRKRHATPLDAVKTGLLVAGREYNLALGERRAQAVKNVLVASGIPATRISTISYGKERPIVVGSNEEAWAQNRVAITTVN